MDKIKLNLKHNYDNERLKQQQLHLKIAQENNQSCRNLVASIETMIIKGKISDDYINNYKSYYTKCNEFNNMVDKYKNDASFRLNSENVNYISAQYNVKTSKVDVILNEIDMAIY